MDKIIVYRSTMFTDSRYCLSVLLAETNKTYKVGRINDEVPYCYRGYNSVVNKQDFCVIFDKNKLPDVIKILDDLEKERNGYDEQIQDITKEKRKAILDTADKIKKCVES